MAGKHNGADIESSSIGPNYISGSKIDRAYAEGRQAGVSDAVTGTDDTSTASTTTMTDSTASFTIDALIGKYITNTTTGGSAAITDNTATVVTHAALSGSNNWDSGDAYHITGGKITDNPHDGAGSPAETAWDAGLQNAADQGGSNQHETAYT